MRLTSLTEEQLDSQQRAFLDRLNDGPRSARQGRIGLIGPYGVWARAPEVGEPAQLLGAALRFGTSLPENIKEVAICTAGACHRAKFEFAAHRQMAARVGVSAAALDALQAGAVLEDVPGLSADEAVAHRFASELVRDHRPGAETYGAAVAAFGEQGTIELTTLIGYYTLVAFTLNTFEVDLLEGMEDPFSGD